MSDNIITVANIGQPKSWKDPKAKALKKELQAAHRAHHALRDTSLPGVSGGELPAARLWHDGTPNQNPAYDNGPEKDRYEAALKAHTDHHAHKLVPHD